MVNVCIHFYCSCRHERLHSQHVMGVRCGLASLSPIKSINIFTIIPSSLNSIYRPHFFMYHLCRWRTTLQGHERVTVFHSKLGQENHRKNHWFVCSPPLPPTPTTNWRQISCLLKRTRSDFPQGLSSPLVWKLLPSFCSSPLPPSAQSLSQAPSPKHFLWTLTHDQLYTHFTFAINYRIV